MTRDKILDCLATMAAARLVESESRLLGDTDLETCKAAAIKRINDAVTQQRFEDARQSDEGLLASIIGESLDAD